MNEQKTLGDKIISLGRMGFWITAATILTSLFFQVASQISLWCGESPNWLSHGFWDHGKAGFTAEELRQSPTRLIVGGTNLLKFLYNLGTATIILFLFRAMWEGRAISPRTAILATVLGVFCFLGIIDLQVDAIPQGERSAGETGRLSIALSLTPFRDIAMGLLAIAAGRIIRLASEQERQLDEII